MATAGTGTQPRLELVGVVLDGPPPLGFTSFSFQEGLTVLYGRNGAGKSRFLSAVRAALEGVRLRSGRSWLVCRVHSPETDLRDNDVDVALWHFWYHLSAELKRKSPISGEPPSRILDVLSALVREYFGRGEEVDDLAAELCRQARFLLQASGTPGSPAWDVWLGAVADEDSPHVTREVERYRQYVEVTSEVRSGRKDETLLDRFMGLSVWQRPLVGHLPPNATDGETWRSPPEPWIPLAAVPLGRWASTRWTSLVEDPVDLSRRTLRVLHRIVDRITEKTSDGGVRFRPEARGALDRLAVDATKFFQKLLLDAPSLFCEFPTVEELFGREGAEPIEWWALQDPPSSAPVPVTALSSAHKRWATISIEAALHDIKISHSDPTTLTPVTAESRWAFERIAIVDEPEQALHTLAQRHLTGALAAGSLPGAMTLVATHSAALLAAPDARLVHISRDREGQVTLASLPREVADPLRAGEFGLDPPELLQLTRLWVLVEGLHDETALNMVIGEELRNLGARIMPIGGARTVKSMLDSRFLFDYTDARILVVLDNTRANVKERWDRAVQLVRAEKHDAARGHIATLRNGSQEERWLYGLLLQAIETNKYARVSCFGMSARDIVYYLPVESFLPGADSWEILEGERRRDVGQAHTNVKDYVHQRGGKISKATVRRAAAQLDCIPDDFAKLLEYARQLVSQASI